MLKLEHNAVLGRMLRVDDLDTLGISTQTLAEEAIRAGRTDEAIALVDYFHQEMRIMHTIMTSRATSSPAAAHPTTLATFRLRCWTSGAPIRSARRCASAARRRFARLCSGQSLTVPPAPPKPSPCSTRCAWSSRTTIAARWGEEAVLESILETHQSIWGDRYENWARMTAHERLALTVEGMRGGHFSGERRRGDVTVRDDGDRLVMVMDLCGSGGVLRRGDPETGRPPHPAGKGDASAALSMTGTNQTPHDWTWQKTGVHWYCSHCAIAMEWLPGRQRGRLLRPLDHVMDPNAPCTWYIYKDEAQTRAYHYPRTSVDTPPDAPDFGEDWRMEYVGGS